MADTIHNPANRVQSSVKGDVIHRGMSVQDIISLFPGAADILTEYGLHCFSCSLGGVETLEEGCAMHGFDDDYINALLVDLNEALKTVSSSPVHVTQAAANGIRQIAVQEQREGEGLAVIVDEHGAFSLEFQETPAADAHIFFHEQEPDVRIFVSPETLLRIGGARIDFRDGRFSLDLPGASCACKEGGQCSC